MEPKPSVGRQNGVDITKADNIAEADARQVERRRSCRQRIRVTQTVRTYAAERAQQLREGHFRADLGILSPTQRIVIDVAVANPAAQPYISPPPGREPSPTKIADPIGRNFAIEHREEEKLIRYRRLIGVDADNPLLFSPFVMTATGSISRRATLFLRQVLLDSDSSSTRACTELLTQLGAAVARYNAMAALAWVRRLIAARTHL